LNQFIREHAVYYPPTPPPLPLSTAQAALQVVGQAGDRPAAQPTPAPATAGQAGQGGQGPEPTSEVPTAERFRAAAPPASVSAPGNTAGLSEESPPVGGEPEAAGGAERADVVALAAHPEEPPPAPQRADRLSSVLPFDWPALEQRVQQFFDHLEDLGQDAGKAPEELRLAPWFVAVSAAMLACEVARRQLRKQIWSGLDWADGPGGRTWTWWDEPAGPPPQIES
jgi:hypothetical protein